MTQSMEEGKINYLIRSLSPILLSNDQLGNRRNLNKISYDTAFDLIESALNLGNNITSVFVDTVGNPEKYQRMLEYHFDKKYPDRKMTFRVESKADANYRCVSAASIVAKYHRDEELESWVYTEKGISPGHDFGCGYPSDPLTKKWLRDNYDDIFGFPQLVRFSWATSKTLIQG